MTSPVRVRYAPSPTGQPHLGNIRTALFNWLYARRHDGRFVLRIEDTDRERYVSGAVQEVLGALKWLHLEWDEGPEVGGPYGPYFQSERLVLYQKAAQRLMQDAHAYSCYCSPGRLEEMRRRQMKNRQQLKYDRYCLNLSAREVRRHQEEGTVPVVRFQMPDAEKIVLHDMIRDEVSWRSELLDDFIILKSDGFPTYHLANVIDDHLMEITHVLRAEEWLPSTPRHLKLYQALGYEPPLFGHLPMILGPDRSKLSKRHGATSILEYKEMGCLPDATVNFMALLGWSLDDKTEIMSRQMLKEHFSIKRVIKSGAIFNREKLLWMNGTYIRQLDLEELGRRLLEFWRDHPPPQVPQPVDQPYLSQILPLVQERIKTLDEAADLVSFFFQEEMDYDGDLLIQKDMDRRSTLKALKQAHTALAGSPAFDAATLEERLRALSGELGLSGRQFFGLLRVATTGRAAAPPLFQTMEILAKNRCLARIDQAINMLAASVAAR